MLFGKPMPEVTLTQLCVDALERFGRPANTKQVREKLARDGHEYGQGQVRATLKYLSTKPNAPVECIKPGVWQLREAGAQAPLTPEPLTAVPAMNGTGGRP